MRTAAPVELNPEQRVALERNARQRSLPARLVERARIVLWASEGLENKQIAAEMGIMPEKAARWRNRFLEGGLAALEKDAPRPGRTRIITERQVKKVVKMTLHQKPANATHWSSAAWRQQQASARPACGASGTPTG
jgi:transposase